MRGLLDTLHKQDRLPADKPYVGFFDLYDKGIPLHPVAGYTPLVLRVRRNKTNKDNTALLLERAEPPQPFVHYGREFVLFETEGAGGHMTYYHAVSRRTIKVYTGVQWLSTGLAVSGDTAHITAHKLSFSPMTDTITAIIISATGTPVKTLDKPLFRLRRTYDTTVATEGIGTGDGVKVYFLKTLANAPICPGSLKITVPGIGGADVIRDNGKGKLIALPPNLRLGSVDDSVNYVTGEIKLSFSPDFIPAAGGLTAGYEHSSDDLVEHSEYDVDWKMDR